MKDKNSQYLLSFRLAFLHLRTQRLRQPARRDGVPPGQPAMQLLPPHQRIIQNNPQKAPNHLRPFSQTYRARRVLPRPRGQRPDLVRRHRPPRRTPNTIVRVPPPRAVSVRGPPRRPVVAHPARHPMRRLPRQQGPGHGQAGQRRVSDRTGALHAHRLLRPHSEQEDGLVVPGHPPGWAASRSEGHDGAGG